MYSSTFGKGWVGMSACPLVVVACESLHVCTVCIWRCEHASFCVEGFYALYINFHSFIHKKERTHGEKGGEKREETTTLSGKKEEANNVNEQRDKGWIHVILVSTRYNPLSSDNTAGQQTLRNYPTQKKNERSL